MSESRYGTVTIKSMKGDKEVEIEDFLRATFKDNRLISIIKLDCDEGYIISIENPESSGRNTSQKMLLTEESLGALLLSLLIYFKQKGIDTEEYLRKVTKNGEDKIEFDFSNNLEKHTESM